VKNKLLKALQFFLVTVSFLFLKNQKILAAEIDCGTYMYQATTGQFDSDCKCENAEYVGVEVGPLGGVNKWCCGWYNKTEDICQAEPTATDTAYELCSMQINQATNTQAWANCSRCMEDGGIWTAVGCIPQTPKAIVETLLEIGLIMSGAIVLIMILAGAFMLSTSQGDPKKTQDARELITSAIIGLLFIVFSITILQFVGVSILRIPGFGE